MTQPRYLAIFDWNATLLDDIHATTEATNITLALFNKPPLSLREQQDIATFPLVHFYERAGVPVADYLERSQEAGEKFISHYQSLLPDCTLRQGSLTLLNFLKAHNITCMVLSNHIEVLLQHDVCHHKLDHYFDYISGNKDPATMVSGTSKLERLQDYMNEHGFDPAHSFIIGDSHEEPAIARQLGLLGISIRGGLISEQRLQTHYKDHIIDHLEELIPILRHSWGLRDGQGRF